MLRIKEDSMHFDEIISAIRNGLDQLRFQDLLDILIIAFLIYKIIDVSVNTRAFQLLKGLAVLLIIMLLSAVFNLYTVNYLLNTLLVSGIVIVIVLFQPEIRRGLAHLGRFRINLNGRVGADGADIVREMTGVLIRLSKRKVGALIVIERDTPLDEYLPTGTSVDAHITGALIENIFEPNTPLHDGAVIIREGRIHYAACVLPLFSDPNISRELGTRHRAALGISSVSDCLTLVVSEETGVISYAENGKLTRYVDKAALSELLEGVFVQDEPEKPLTLLTKRLFKNDSKR
jgi:diadenylate cyclase